MSDSRKEDNTARLAEWPEYGAIWTLQIGSYSGLLLIFVSLIRQRECDEQHAAAAPQRVP